MMAELNLDTARKILDAALAGVGIALLIGVLGALVPSLNASRIKIVDGLRFVD